MNKMREFKIWFGAFNVICSIVLLFIFTGLAINGFFKLALFYAIAAIYCGLTAITALGDE